MEKICKDDKRQWNADCPKQDASHNSSRTHCYSNVNANFSEMFRRNIQGTDGFGKNSFV